MQKVLRIIFGVVVVGLVLHGAGLATRDCRVAPYVYDNCMWMGIRNHLGLPASRFLRMGVLECVGIFFAVVLYLTFRYVFPFRRLRKSAPDPSQPLVAAPPGE